MAAQSTQNTAITFLCTRRFMFIYMLVSLLEHLYLGHAWNRWINSFLITLMNLLPVEIMIEWSLQTQCAVSVGWILEFSKTYYVAASARAASAGAQPPKLLALIYTYLNSSILLTSKFISIKTCYAGFIFVAALQFHNVVLTEPNLPSKSDLLKTIRSKSKTAFPKTLTNAPAAVHKDNICHPSDCPAVTSSAEAASSRSWGVSALALSANSTYSVAALSRFPSFHY
ncbi:hypothetical protein AC578_7674 [Pseudocercospora eumusae]|uniref:Uncharacterized protein n=1 Tax=Pseudocercospora eumusae TaxID=321146 RepID=A0A139GVF4_9PEZI|nr:hypothetical protein AC578_7674 [Pseudocercospora eumusae]KXS94156.1 hypothetical protein AC578_7674 [Pseudocercospora eumusae]